MGDIFKLLPLIFKLLPHAAALKTILTLLAPAIAELRKALPQIVPLARAIIKDVWPELDRQMLDPGVLVQFDVTWLQTSLKKLGYRLEVDGDPGDETKAAVKAFQKDHGLEADGWAGVVTCGAIWRALK